MSGRGCPICGKEPSLKEAPFCSARCRNVDLHRWLSGAYAIPVESDEDEDGAPLTPSPKLSPDA